MKNLYKLEESEEIIRKIARYSKTLQEGNNSSTKRYINICVHNGYFHADDVLCVALLDYFFENNIRIERSRDPNRWAKNQFVLDVGDTDEVNKNHVMFDHHQPNSESYKNGIKMAACGKLARWMFKDICNPFYQFLLKELLYAVEANDNGQDSKEYPNSLLNFITLFNIQMSETTSENEKTKAFMKAVKLTKEILRRLVVKYNQRKIDSETLESDLITYGINGYLELSRYIPTDRIVEQNKKFKKTNPDKIIKVISYPGEGNDHKVQCINVDNNTFETYMLPPKEWFGLRGDDLKKVSKLSSASFCHASGFLMGFGKISDARKAAVKILGNK